MTGQNIFIVIITAATSSVAIVVISAVSYLTGRADGLRAAQLGQEPAIPHDPPSEIPGGVSDTRSAVREYPELADNE